MYLKELIVKKFVKQPESIEETLSSIERAGYLDEQERLISCARIIMNKAGLKFRHWGAYNRDDKFHSLRRNHQLDYIKQSQSIALHQASAEELNLGATAVAIGYCEQWYYTSHLGALLRNPCNKSWLIWPLTEGESNDRPYRVEATDIALPVYLPSELPEVLGFDKLDRFASVIDTIELSYGDLKLPRHS